MKMNQIEWVKIQKCLKQKSRTVVFHSPAVVVSNTFLEVTCLDEHLLWLYHPLLCASLLWDLWWVCAEQTSPSLSQFEPFVSRLHSSVSRNFFAFTRYSFCPWQIWRSEWTPKLSQSPIIMILTPLSQLADSTHPAIMKIAHIFDWFSVIKMWIFSMFDTVVTSNNQTFFRIANLRWRRFTAA